MNIAATVLDEQGNRMDANNIVYKVENENQNTPLNALYFTTEKVGEYTIYAELVNNKNITLKKWHKDIVIDEKEAPVQWPRSQ